MIKFSKVLMVVAAILFVGCSERKSERLTFVAGSYEATAQGHNGDMRVRVTFNDSCLERIEVLEQTETPHVGDIVFDKLIPRMVEANGTGVDALTGATVTSRALMKAVNDAARQAKVSDLKQFQAKALATKNTEMVEGTWDVVIIGAGGAGLSAAAEAAQLGNTVLVIEKNAEMGGNTLLSGGIYQSAVPYLVWDSAHPDAKTGTGYDGKTYAKVKSGTGCIADLELILQWDERPFDEAYYKSHTFEPGNLEELSKHGVHSEYLPTLQALKKEIAAYMAWAKPKLQRGVAETELTLFSTPNLHIFQSYYGGLRQSADEAGETPALPVSTSWVYSSEPLLRQVVEQGQELKPWLMKMGVNFLEQQVIIVGMMWYRGNVMTGADIDTDGDGTTEHYDGNWGAYILAPYTAFIGANKENRLMKATTAKDLIVENGRVTGVTARMADGTNVTAHARKGVIICTGGYAANIRKVIETNRYWKKEWLTNRMATTNRSSQQGDGIWMAQKVNAGTTGMGWTQLMPLGFVDYGNLAFGSVVDAIFVSGRNGRRFVDETRERDVLTIKAFENGITMMGKQGAYLYIRGESSSLPTGGEVKGDNVPGKQYIRTPDQLGALFKELKINVKADEVIKTIRDYDQAIMAGVEPQDVGKRHAASTIGNVKRRADGSYDASTYSLDSTRLIIRTLAPSTHHTMGGLVVDEQRRVLDANGQPIPGLYAAGEVTGGIHGGNRLGGNALTEIMVSGRIAAGACGN
jgi:fumarate reductase flavoprotein subunit